MLAGRSSWLARVACIVRGDMATVCGVWVWGGGTGSGGLDCSTGDSFDILIDPFEDIWASRGDLFDRK